MIKAQLAPHGSVTVHSLAQNLVLIRHKFKGVLTNFTRALHCAKFQWRENGRVGADLQMAKFSQPHRAPAEGEREQK